MNYEFVTEKGDPILSQRAEDEGGVLVIDREMKV